MKAGYTALTKTCPSYCSATCFYFLNVQRPTETQKTWSENNAAEFKVFIYLESLSQICWRSVRVKPCKNRALTEY